ncbi:hypothetical protein HPB48_020107 [Haemaphysalis longicornis]|uniref:Peptidase M13 N-terminal domain-containing protein n=1 Tax=Haemaphysalis longicornis TaxID=44386 RepID=A0A9J6FNC1_HAELO|nr:hypothetical protein HPB48_020107 [Haemaphysalis longicornis]
MDLNQFSILQRKISFSLYDDIRQRSPAATQSLAAQESAQALRMCEDIFINRENNLEGLRAFLSDHQLGWPDSPDSEFDALDTLVRLSLDSDVHVLFQVKLVPNFKLDDRLILSMSQNPNLLSWFQHRAFRLPGAAFGKALLHIAKAMGNPRENYVPLVEDLVQMETYLMSVYFEVKEKDLIGYAQFQELGDLSAGRISSERWNMALNRYLPEGTQMSAVSELYLIGSSYLAVTGHFLSKYSRNADRLRSFVSWHVVRSLLPLASYDLYKVLMAEANEAQMAIAPFALSHFFFAKFLPEGSLRTAYSMVSKIRESSVSAFRNLSWMEESTRRVAVDKLSSLHEVVAFPKELSSPEAIDAHYSHLPRFRRPFLRTYTESLRASLFVSKPLLLGGRGNRSINRELYLHAQPIAVNAYYMFVYHVMFICPPSSSRPTSRDRCPPRRVSGAWDTWWGTRSPTSSTPSWETWTRLVSRCVPYKITTHPMRFESWGLSRA